jgi:acetyltransferase-like isoleucine patch superfamily enzyme
VKKRISLLLYYFIANRLPSSFFPAGKLFNKIRTSLAGNFLTIGSNSKIQPRVNFGDGNDIIIGRHCMINENVYIQKAIIGDYVMIAPNVALYATSHVFDRLDIPMVLQGKTTEEACIIEDNVWIGRNAVIMPGIRIGSGSIVGSGAVVTKDVEQNSIVGGVPAKLLRKRI